MKNANLDGWRLRCRSGWGDNYCGRKGYGKFLVGKLRRRESRIICHKYIKGIDAA